MTANKVIANPSCVIANEVKQSWDRRASLAMTGTMIAMTANKVIANEVKQSLAEYSGKRSPRCAHDDGWMCHCDDGEYARDDRKVVFLSDIFNFFEVK